MYKGKVFTKYDYERLQTLMSNSELMDRVGPVNVNCLKHGLTHCRLVDPREIRPNIVTMNSTICLKNLGNGKKKIVSLVFPQDCDRDDDKINVFSLIGTQVLGSPIGTVIKPNPADEQYFVIEEIIYQPESAGDYNQ